MYVSRGKESIHISWKVNVEELGIGASVWGKKYIHISWKVNVCEARQLKKQAQPVVKVGQRPIFFYEV